MGFTPAPGMTETRVLGRLPRLIQANLVLLALLVAALCAVLWPHWRQDPNLSHGYFMPLLFLLLLHEGRQRGPWRYTAASPARAAALAFLAGSGILLLAAGGVYAASVGWSHPLVAFTLTVGCVALLATGGLAMTDRAIQLLPLNWSVLVAVGLWLLCAPIPPGTYARLTLGLQLAVSEHVLSALHLLGVAASRHGNIIELANTSVGIEEACSGVRSLVSCVFAGFFFSATFVRRPWARAFIIALAAPLALVMNFIRSLTLTLLANRGVDIAGTWHDVTGFAVLGVTAVLLGGLALLLEQAGSARPPPPADPAAMPRRAGAQFGVTASLLLTAAIAGIFFVKTRPVARADAPVPDLLQILPAAADGWNVVTSEDLYQFRGILQTDHLAQRTYWRRENGQTVQVTVYLAYWPAGQSSVGEVSMHTPDACWPGAGWQVTPIATPREQLSVAGGRTLPVAEARRFRHGELPQFVWFWHLYNGQPIAYEDPRSALVLLTLAWQHGFTRNGSQLFVRVSSNQPWDQIRDDPVIATIFRRLEPLGL